MSIKPPKAGEISCFTARSEKELVERINGEGLELISVANRGVKFVAFYRMPSPAALKKRAKED